MAQEGLAPMHPQSIPGGAGTSAPRPKPDPQEVYEIDLRGLLDLLLEEFPGVLTYREALTARVDDPEDFGEADRFSNAVHGLISSGLVIRQGELLIPSSPVREMGELGFTFG